MYTKHRSKVKRLKRKQFILESKRREKIVNNQARINFWDSFNETLYFQLLRVRRSDG